MEIINKITDYQSTAEEAIFSVEGANPNDVTTVDIMVSGEEDFEVIARKRFAGLDSFDINIAPYLKAESQISPEIKDKIGPATKTRPLAYAYIRIGNVESVTMVLSNSAASLVSKKRLSDSPDKTDIPKNGYDEISFIIPSGETATPYLTTTIRNVEYSTQLSAGISPQLIYYGINVDDAIMRLQSLTGFEAIEINNFRIEMRFKSGEKIVKEYILRDADPAHTTLCWINRYGVLEFYHFATKTKTSVTAEKDKIYTEEGYKNIFCETETLYTLTTRYEPEQTIEWLAGIMAASKVWIIDDRTPTVIDVVDTSAETMCAGNPVRLNITVRKNEKTRHI